MNELFHEGWLNQIADHPLPDEVKTKGGAVIFPQMDYWNYKHIGTHVNCNFKLLPEVTPIFLHGYKLALIDSVISLSGATVQSIFNDSLRLIRFHVNNRRSDFDELSFEDIAQWARSSRSAETRAASIRSFLQKWSKLKYPGISPEIAHNYPPCKQGPTGVAVSIQDAIKGPFDNQEFEAILNGLNHALESGDIELDRALEVRLVALLGLRPKQLALAKCCDLSRDKYGRVILRSPLIKGKNQGMRDEFRRFPLEPTTGEVLLDYCETVKQAFSSLLAETGEAPLFPALSTDITTQNDIPGLEYHTSDMNMTTRIIRTLKKIQANSVRLGGKIVSGSAVRFRRSFAQRGAEEGIDIFTLAHLMGHRNTRNVKVYFEITNRIRANFSKKITLQMAPLAQAFGAQLHILRSEVEATRPTPSSRIPDLRLDEHSNLKTLASCASCSQCSQLRPIACYAGCRSFEPWLDADHESVLDRMLADRELRMEVDERIAQIRDLAILGCAQIVLRCRDILDKQII